jgi:hypothetical protein
VGGGQELPLAEAPEVLVETLQKADKSEVFLSKTVTVILGVVLAISVLANLALAWKLWAGKKPEVKNEMPKIESDRVPEESGTAHSEEVEVGKKPRMEEEKAEEETEEEKAEKLIVRVREKVNDALQELGNIKPKQTRIVIEEIERFVNIARVLQGTIRDLERTNEDITRSFANDQTTMTRLIQWVETLQGVLTLLMVGREINDQDVLDRISNMSAYECKEESPPDIDNVFKHIVDIKFYDEDRDDSSDE